MADTSLVESSEAYKKVMDDNDPTNWILLNQEANNQIAVCAYGQGGYDEMIQYLDETKSQFGYFRVIAIDSSSEFTSKRAKFVFFSYVGPKVSLMYRAKVSILVSGVHRLFNRSHIEFQISNIEEMTKEIICNDLTRCAGAHAPDSYIFDNQDITSTSVLESTPTADQEIGDFDSLWAEFKGETGINWMIMTIDKSDVISVVARGTNGFNEMKEHLSPDQVAYGIFKVRALNNVGTIESVRERYVVITWVPSAAPVFTRVKVSNQKTTFLKRIEAYHAEMRADCLEDLTEEAVIDLLNRSTGSHKPEKYEF